MKVGGRSVNIEQAGASVHAADNSAALNRAYEACEQDLVPSLIIPEGEFVCTNDVYIRTKTVLRGCSRKSVLKFTNGASLKTLGFDTLFGQGLDEGPYGFRLEKFSIDGGGLNLYGASYQIDDVHIRNVDGTGFISDAGPGGFGPGNAATTDTLEAHINDLVIQECSEGAVKFYGPHDSIMVGLVTALSSAMSNVQDNVLIDSGGTQIHNSHVWGNGPAVALRLKDTGSNIISDSQFEGGNDSQVVIDNSSSVIMDNLRIFGRGLNAQRGLVIDRCAGSRFSNLYISSCPNGAIDYVNDFGHNQISATVVGSGIVEKGTPDTRHTERRIFGRVGGTNAGSYMLNPQDTELSFYGTTPTPKQIGVPVTAAGIHQALVNLGLLS